MLAHVPSGEGSCYKFHSREYRRIIERFHQTISAQFNGHTHLDEFSIFYTAGSNAAHAVSVAWNGGGTTPYHWINPNYILYYVDRQIYVRIVYAYFRKTITVIRFNSIASQ